MTIRDEIEAVRINVLLTEAAKRTQITDIKSEAIRAAFPTFPVIMEWRLRGTTSTITINAIKKVALGLEIDMDIIRGGTTVIYDKPWVIINPPVLVEDVTGDVIIGDRTFKEAPQLALRQIVRDFVESLT